MAEKEQETGFKKAYSGVNDTLKFLSLLIGIIISAITLWGKIASADDTVKKTYEKVEQLNSKIIYIQGRLGIPPQ